MPGQRSKDKGRIEGWLRVALLDRVRRLAARDSLNDTDVPIASCRAQLPDIAGARILDLELGPLLHHPCQVIERHIAGGLGVIETPVGIFFYDDRLGLGLFFRHAFPAM